MKFVVGDVPKTRNKQDKQSPPESAQASAEEDGAGSDLEQEVIDEDLHTEIVADRVFSREQCPNHIPTQPRASRVRLCTSCVSSGPIQRHTTPWRLLLYGEGFDPGFIVIRGGLSVPKAIR